MTLEQLKYALEVANTGSINKASENLFVSQSNLSRAIKQLEDEIGFKIFSRNSHGVEITLQGQDFLVHTQKIMDNLKKIDLIAHPEKENQDFSISVPKAHYITKTFFYFISKIKEQDHISIDYKESSAIGAIGNILNNNINLGIIRYQDVYIPLFNWFLKDIGIIQREITAFTYHVAFSENSSLAKKEKLYQIDFKDYIEVTHGDSILPSVAKESKNTDYKLSEKSIRVYDSMGQLQLLNEIPNAFMIVFPLDEATLKKYHLVQRVIEDYQIKARDYLISKSNYVGSKLDKIFFDELERNARNR